MKKQLTLHRMHFPRLLAFILALFLTGCPYHVYDVPSSPPPDDPPPPTQVRRTAEEVDADLHRLKQKIEDMKEFENQQRQIAVINDVQNHKSRGWIKGDGKPSYEDLADQAYGQAAAAEKEVQRLERELARVEKEKQAILNESRGCFPADTLVQMDNGAFKRFEQIVPGDRVLTYDIGYDQVVSRPVRSLYTVEANHLYTINGAFRTTGGERLLTPSGWKKVRHLQVGPVGHVQNHQLF